MKAEQPFMKKPKDLGMDASQWAREFMTNTRGGGFNQTDLMVWFASALMSGYHQGLKDGRGKK